MEERRSFKEYLDRRAYQEKIKFFALPAIQKAYFIGGYAKAVIDSSYHSEVSKENNTFKTWLSNQIINYRNLDRIFEMCFRFEQKLKLKINNQSEVRMLAHDIPVAKSKGISSAKISFAFVAGFDDYREFTKVNKEERKNKDKNEIESK